MNSAKNDDVLGYRVTSLFKCYKLIANKNPNISPQAEVIHHVTSAREAH